MTFDARLALNYGNLVSCTCGFTNTKYFDAVANQRKRKMTIHCLEGPARVVESAEDIMEVAT
jgi:hypothetical protein